MILAVLFSVIAPRLHELRHMPHPAHLLSLTQALFFDLLLGINIIDINFEIIINFASFLAIAFFFRKDIMTLIRNVLKGDKKQELNIYYFFKLILASIPAVTIVLFFKNTIDRYLMSILTVGLSFIVTGILLGLTSTIKGKYHDTNITYPNSFFIGLVQALALIPGISRSGATLSGGLFLKRDVKATLRFSFFMYMI